MEKTTYSNKRNTTRKKIDSVFIENFRLYGYDNLTVKEICKRAGINRSTFYTYYKDAIDIREQIEDRLISQLKKRLTTVADRYFDDPDAIIGEIMAYNREKGYIPLLLISDGSGNFLYRVSNIAIEMPRIRRLKQSMKCKWLVLALKCINIHAYTLLFSALYNAAQRLFRLYLFWDSRDQTIVSVLG